MPLFSHILFDLDGTLTDPKEGITKSIQFALREMGVRPPSLEGLSKFIGPPLAKTFAQLLKSSDEALINQAIGHYRIRYTKLGMFENEVYSDVARTLEVLKSLGVRLLVATSKPQIFAIKILDHFGLSPYFNATYGSELDGRLSDKGELLAHILRCEMIDPACALMVGDREHDVFGGQKNGVKTAAVLYGYGSRKELVAARPDFILERVAELSALLRA